MPLSPVSKSLFFSKGDENDPRLGDIVKAVRSPSELSPQDTVILGYPDNEGIQLNGGRLGAEEGPEYIRRHLYKMTPEPFGSYPRVVDMGDLKPEKDIKDSHEAGRNLTGDILKTGASLVGIGGGHDYGYCDGAGFLDSLSEADSARPLIVNFDAHLDVRPTDKGYSSGTPFFRLLESEHDFDFVEIGLQKQCNSQKHFEWFTEKGGKALWLDEIVDQGKPPLQSMLAFLEPYILKKRPTFLSLDMDAFSSAYAPGCSQVFSTGLAPLDVIPLIKILCARLDVRVCSVYETSPLLDVDDRTSQLAALLIHTYLHSK